MNRTQVPSMTRAIYHLPLIFLLDAMRKPIGPLPAVQHFDRM